MKRRGEKVGKNFSITSCFDSSIPVAINISLLKNNENFSLFNKREKFISQKKVERNFSSTEKNS
jgi:hypothetical protein